jgi:hypothetical protein
MIGLTYQSNTELRNKLSMPVGIEAVTLDSYNEWLHSFGRRGGVSRTPPPALDISQPELIEEPCHELIRFAPNNSVLLLTTVLKFKVLESN